LKPYIGVLGLMACMLAGLLFYIFNPATNKLSSSIIGQIEKEEFADFDDAAAFSDTDSTEITNFSDEESVAPQSGKNLLAYLGIPQGGYTVHEDIIRKNEGFGDILSECNLSGAALHSTLRTLKGNFNPKSLKADKTYMVVVDQEQNPHFWVYEESPHNYVVIDFRGNPHVYSCAKEIERKLSLATGVVHGSLHATLSNNNLNPALAAELAKVFAYSIDFFKLKKGDKFKAIYEDVQIDGQSVGIGEIKAAYFEHKSEPYYAFAFTQDGHRDYYNEEGKSLKKAFLKSPLKFTRISSKYTMKRFHPILQRYKPHLGTDYAAAKGTPIMTIGDGTVIEAAYSGGNGKYVKIKHNQTYTTQYLHMSKFAKGIKRGAQVKQGQVIGYVGSTGLATGPHLCFRFWKNGKQVDPHKEKPPRSNPIKNQNMALFQQHADSLKNILDNLKYEVQAEDLMSPL